MNSESGDRVEILLVVMFIVTIFIFSPFRTIDHHHRVIRKHIPEWSKYRKHLAWCSSEDLHKLVPQINLLATGVKSGVLLKEDFSFVLVELETRREFQENIITLSEFVKKKMVREGKSMFKVKAWNNIKNLASETERKLIEREKEAINIAKQTLNKD